MNKSENQCAGYINSIIGTCKFIFIFLMAMACIKIAMNNYEEPNVRFFKQYMANCENYLYEVDLFDEISCETLNECIFEFNSNMLFLPVGEVRFNTVEELNEIITNIIPSGKEYKDVSPALKDSLKDTLCYILRSYIDNADETNYYKLCLKLADKANLTEAVTGQAELLFYGYIYELYNKLVFFILSFGIAVMISNYVFFICEYKYGKEKGYW